MKSHGTMGIVKGGVNLRHIRARLTSENVTSGHNRREPSTEYQNGLGFWDRKPSIWWVYRQRSDRRTVGDFPSNIPSARSSSLTTVLDTSLNVVWHLQLLCNGNFKCKSWWKLPAKQSCQNYVLHLLRSGWTTVKNAKDSDKVLLEIGLILINKVRLSWRPLTVILRYRQKILT